MDFSILDYRVNLKKIIKSNQVKEKFGGIVKVAEKSGMHGPFFSAVLGQKNHLSQDQLYSVCRLLELKKEAYEFLGLCLEYAKSGNFKRQRELKTKLQYLQKSRLKTEKFTKAKKANVESVHILEYYSDPYYIIINTFLQIEHYTRHLEKIPESLNISIERFNHYIERLEEFGFIQKINGQVKVLSKNFHLEKKSFIRKNHQTALKNLCLRTLESLSEENQESVCVTFSGGESAYKKIHEKFLTFLREAEAIVLENDKISDVYQMNFDIFRWSK